MKKITLLCLSLFLTACASKVPLNDPNQKPLSTLSDTNSNQGVAEQQTVATVDVTNSQNKSNLITPEPKTVYFDTDSYVVKSEFQDVVTKHQAFITKNSSKVLLQGHTDQRGTSEYNLALGQKRAEAVKKSLTVLGVKGENIETVSFGKEKPVIDETNEAAYSKNRRVEILYK
ncbi:MAG: Peptidoglycan-associated lipoprotein [Pseudomonadota bacterium]|jgi:peptidoglycan-associated lipoprotein